MISRAWHDRLYLPFYVLLRSCLWLDYSWTLSYHQNVVVTFTRLPPPYGTFTVGGAGNTTPPGRRRPPHAHPLLTTFVRLQYAFALDEARPQEQLDSGPLGGAVRFGDA